MVVVVVTMGLAACSKKEETKPSVPRPATIAEELEKAPANLVSALLANEAAAMGTDCAKATDAVTKMVDATSKLVAAEEQLQALSASDPSVKAWADAEFRGQAVAAAGTSGMKMAKIAPDAPCKGDPAFAAKLKEFGGAMGFKRKPKTP